MKRVIGIIFIAAFALLPFAGRADEGMWMVHALTEELLQKMEAQGLEIEGNVIYDEAGVSLSDAVVALDFYCTGSVISNEGLMITNHHCAYSYVHDLSTPEHNYLEDGFWAFERGQEKPLKRCSVFFLRKVIDVTQEVNNGRDSIVASGKKFTARRFFAQIEGKYKTKYGLEASCDCMWRGEKYYMSLYEVYKDVRLVAAPPVSVAAYGGDMDNWEWPQQKCDFALYRIYTAPDGSPAEFSENNIPLKPKKSLKISTEGIHLDDYAMVLGYGGHTDRYRSSYSILQSMNVTTPIEISVRKEQMKIIGKWMNEDPSVRLKYSDNYFNLSNFQEYKEGEQQYFRELNVAGIKAGEEMEMDCDSLKELLKEKYEAVSSIERNSSYYRESIVRGSRLIMLYYRLSSLFRQKESSSDSIVIADDNKEFGVILNVYRDLDMRVEKDLFSSMIRIFCDNIDSCYLSPYLDSVKTACRGDFDGFVEDVWEKSYFGDTAKLVRLFQEPHSPDFYMQDPIYRVFDMPLTVRFNRLLVDKEGTPNINQCEKEYTRQLYASKEKRGIMQYPDANSSMRLTYGNVVRMEPKDGVIDLERSTTDGILQKYDPSDYDFSMKPEFKKLLESRDWGRWGDNGVMQVDFLTNNDITGGNSGSPVLNGKGELVGLAFDGNKESLAGDAYYQPGLNNCVCVDIRYVLWVLDKYVGMENIISELGF